jgi:lipopolysaccharide heptosyltransferase II
MNILLIQMLRLGDALQMIPIIRGLKRHFPGCRISVLTSTVGRWVFDRDPEVDRVHVLEKQRIAELSARGRKGDILAALSLTRCELEPLLSVHWDWVINFSFSYPSALVSFLLHADRRSGFLVNEHRQFLSRERWFALSLASFTHRRFSSFNWVDINRKIVGLPSVPRHPLIRPAPEALEKAAHHLRTIGFQGKRLVGFNPGASGPHKMWPVERFGRLGRGLAEKHDLRILLFGGKGEEGLGRALKGLMGEKAEDLSGRTTLDELAAYLSLCDVLVTNDTGPMHLAYSVGTRVISLFFNSHFVETGPYGRGHVAIHPDLPCFPCQGLAACEEKKCLSSISPENVERVILHGAPPDPALSSATVQGNRPVQAHVADFDPWGVLEWSPLHTRTLSMPVLERFILRSSWLYHCNMVEEECEKEGGPLARSLAGYGVPQDRKEILSALAGLTDSLLAFKARLKRAHACASEIHKETIDPRPDVGRISSLGAALGSAERELFSGENGSVVSFIGELLKVYLEFIEMAHMAELSRRTMSVYHEILRFTELVMAGVEEVERMLGAGTVSGSE